MDMDIVRLSLLERIVEEEKFVPVQNRNKGIRGYRYGKS